MHHLVSFAALFTRWLLVAGVAMPVSAAKAQERPSPPRPGIAFQSAETRALQADDARNPGMLWVEQGERLWAAPVGTAGSCATCHGAATPMADVATRYPRVEADMVMTLEGRINACRSTRQGAAPFAYESPELLGLAAYLTYLARGRARATAIPTDSPWFERGRALFHMRQGQLNLACTQCHDGLVGKKLRGDTISQAQTHGWPAYRLEWQTLGSLQRRLRACSLGVRAEVLDFGHPDYLALELYLAWRGEGLAMESPGVRR